METSIHYLNEVHGDLLDVVERWRADATNGHRSTGGSPGRSPGRLVAAAVSILAAAAVVGLIAQGDVSFLSSSDDAGAAGSVARPADAATGATGGAEAGDGSDDAFDPSPAPAGGAPSSPPDVGGETLRVIRTAEIAVEIPRDTFEARFGDAADIAEENGGFVAESSSRDRSGSVMLRVPAASFDETLRALRELGDVEVQSIRGRDVTAEYVDLVARLRIATARRVVLLELMDEAVSIEQTIRVQNALDETQLRVEQLQGQRRLLDDRTSLATITLDLREEGVQRVEQVGKASIPNAFERAVAGFVGVIAAIVIGLGYLLPILAIGSAGWFIATRVRRRRERR